MNIEEIIKSTFEEYVYNDVNQAGDELRVIDANDLEDIIKKIVKKLPMPYVGVSVCSCGLPADGTLYAKPMCEGCLHKNT